MNFYRQTIKDAPAAVSIPKEFRNRDVEIIILPLDETVENGDAAEVNANGYPIGFFEATAGSLPDFPEREPQPIHSELEKVE